MNGNAAPTVLKVAPVTLAPVTDKLDPPVFEMVTFCVIVVFATMLPNETLVGDTAICAAGELIVTVAEAYLLMSAALVARTV